MPSAPDPKSDTDLVARLDKTVRKLKNSKTTIPYVVADTMPVQPLPDLLASKAPGLLASEHVSVDGSITLVSYWISRDHYLASRDLVRSTIPESQVSYEGYLVNVQTKHTSWTEATWKEWLLGASAVWGALAALGALFPFLLAWPQADLQINMARSDFYRGARLDTKVTVRNTGRFAAIDITEATASLTPQNDPKETKVKLDVNPREVFGIAPGTPSDLTAVGQTSPVSGEGLVPLEYALDFSATVKAGFLVPAKPFRAKSVPVTIWRSHLSRDRPLLLGNPGATIASFTGNIYSALAQKDGASGMITLSQKGITQIQLYCWPVTCTTISTLSSSDGDGHNVEFSTGALSEFQRITYRINVTAAKALPQTQWREIANNISLNL